MAKIVIKINKSTKLVHVTHTEPAGKIINEDPSVRFSAAQKCGRNVLDPQTYGSYRIVTNKHQQQQEIPVPPAQSLICDGEFSWWSIELKPEDHGIRPCDASKAFITTKSMYGPAAFSVEFGDLITAYINSRDFPNYVLKKGGTLKYQQEVCKIIIVCLKNDVFLRENEEMDFEEFNIEDHLSICCPYQGGQWDHYAFAFYFPNNHPHPYLLVDPICVELSHVEHKFNCKQRLCPDRDIEHLKNRVSELQKDLKRKKEIIITTLSEEN